jgi:cytochrome c-type biogenesis protein CcmH
VRRLLALLAVLALLGAPASAVGLTVTQVAREVRCPTCNTPLDVSNSPAAERMKLYIAERIDRGWDKGRIIDALVEEFGPGVRVVPPKSGFDLVAWLVPLGAVLAGLVSIPILTRLWARRRRPVPAAPQTDLSADEALRLDEELRRRPL